MSQNWKPKGRKIRVKEDTQENSSSKHSKLPTYLASAALLGLGALFLSESKPTRNNTPVVQQPEKKEPTISIIRPATMEELVGHNRIYQPASEASKLSEFWSSKSSDFDDPRGRPFRNTLIYERLPDRMKAELSDFTLFGDVSTRLPKYEEAQTMEQLIIAAIDKDPHFKHPDYLKIKSELGNVPLNIENLHAAVAVQFIDRSEIVDVDIEKNNDLIEYLAEFIDAPELRNLPVTIPRSMKEIPTDRPGIVLLKRMKGVFQTGHVDIDKEGYKGKFDMGCHSYTSDAGGYFDYSFNDKTGEERIGNIYLVRDFGSNLGISGYEEAACFEGTHLALLQRRRRLSEEAFKQGTYTQSFNDGLIHEEEVFGHAVGMIVYKMFLREHLGIDAAKEIQEFAKLADTQPLYSGVSEMHRRLRVEPQEESVSQLIGRQRKALLEAKQRYMASSYPAFDFIQTKHPTIK
jgi:hypothetical protein